MQLMQEEEVERSNDDNEGTLHDESESLLQCQVYSMLSSFHRYYPDKIHLACQYAETGILLAKKLLLFDDVYIPSRQRYHRERLVKSLIANLEMSSFYHQRETSILPYTQFKPFSPLQTPSQRTASVENWVDHIVEGAHLIDRVFKLRSNIRPESLVANAKEALEIDAEINQLFDLIPVLWQSEPEMIDFNHRLPSSDDAAVAAAAMRCILFSRTIKHSLKCLLMQAFSPYDIPYFHQIALSSARRLLTWLPHM